MLLLSADRVAAQDLDSLTLADVVAKLEQRRQNIRSARFSWTVECWHTQAMSYGGQQTIRERNIPEEGRRWTKECSLVFEDSLVRFEMKMPYWSGQANQYTEQRGVFVWNHEEGQHLTEQEDDLSGIIYGFNFYATNELKPFLFAFRMTDTEWTKRFQAKDFVLADRDATLDGSRCLLIEHSPKYLKAKVQARRNPVKFSYWVDPSKDFAIVRHTKTVNGKPARDVRLTYQENAEFGWIPAAWTETQGGGAGGPGATYDGTVTSFELNIPVDEKTFVLDYPDGTVLRDLRTKDVYLVIDGSRRPISREDLRRAGSREALVAEMSEQPNRWIWLLLIAGIAVTVGVAIKSRRAG